MKKKYKRLAVLLMVILCIVAGAVYLMTPVKVESETVAAMPFEETFTVQGKVEPEESKILTCALSGEVTKLEAKEGEAVKSGEIIVQVDDSDARKSLENQISGLQLEQKSLKAQGSSSAAGVQASLQQAKAALDAARSEYDSLFGTEGSADDMLNSARNHYSEMKEIHIDLIAASQEEGSTVTDDQVAAAETARAAAKQQLLEIENKCSDSSKSYYESMIAAYESQVDSLKSSSSQTTAAANASADSVGITVAELEEKLAKEMPSAPYDGIVWEIYVEEGSMAAEGAPLARVYKEGALKLTADVLTEEAMKLSVGDPCLCTLADGTAFEAKVSFVSTLAREVISSLGISENRCSVELDADNLPEKLGAGYDVELSFASVLSENALTVPVSSVVASGTESGVYVIQSGKAVLTPVETGKTSAGRIEITEGIAEGDTVITNPSAVELKDGSRVTE